MEQVNSTKRSFNIITPNLNTCREKNKNIEANEKKGFMEKSSDRNG